MGNWTHMRGLCSIPTEGSRHYYSPSVDGPVRSKLPYMDVVGGSKSPLTEETSFSSGEIFVASKPFQNNQVLKP